ncbi:MAG: hypothetical protein FWB96_09940 [Defluviitaleaceae bacterium]|nr:hypothetical protein [Defluviitaleaceae bacterium]MCL2263160.1 hypothetical protein [Defluviitaleaceae bacterium]
MRLSQDNHEQVLELFNSYWQGRIGKMNARISSEHARNPHGYHWSNRIEGLEYNHAELWSTRTIELPEGTEEAMITFTRDLHSRMHGKMSWQDVERRRILMHSILPQVAVQDRHAAIRQMEAIAREESSRITNAIREHVPSWMPGQRVSNEILRPILNGHGGNVDITV